MTYRGTIRNGVVVFDRGTRPREGTQVEVRPFAAGGRGKKTSKQSSARPPRGSPQAVLRHRGTWQGEPGEMDRLLAELKRMKQAEVDAERTRLSQSAAGSGTRGSARGRNNTSRRRSA